MHQAIVECDECGMPGLDPDEDMCGEWIGTPQQGGIGYACPDIICPDCRGDEDSNAEA